jgi:hypothetical protein
MSVLSAAIYNVLANDAALAGLLSTYQGQPAVFTTDPAPGDAVLPYIVTAGEIAQVPFDTKTTRGRSTTRDVRCYSAASGSAITVEAIAERVRALLHRQAIAIDNFEWIIGDCSGPIVADEQDAYARIISVSITIEED